MLMIDSDKNFEDEEAVIAFAKNPFGGIEPRELFFQESDEFNEDIKSVGADASTTFINKLIFYNSEKAGFSDPTLPEKNTSAVPESSVPEDSSARTFVAVSPSEMLFGFGTGNRPENRENEISGNENEDVKNGQKNQNPLEENAGMIENTASPENSEDFEELEKTDDMITLQENSFSGGFLFSRFASNYGDFGEIKELPVDAIIQDKDGVFSISDEISSFGAAQNQEFMNLVQSVLRN